MTKQGFTLAELLISLAILGVIATFTIPKVLNGSTSQEYNSMANELSGTISQVHQQLKLEGKLSASTSSADFTPYFNYVKIDTVSQVDTGNNNLSVTDCSMTGTNKCLLLHNGAMLVYYPAVNFGGVNNTNAIFFMIDPDARYSGAVLTGPHKALCFTIMAVLQIEPIPNPIRFQAML